MKTYLSKINFFSRKHLLTCSFYSSSFCLWREKLHPCNFFNLKNYLCFLQSPFFPRKEWKPDIFIAILLTYQIHKKFHGLLCDNIFGIVDQQGTILSVKLHAEIAQRKSDKIEQTSENRFGFVCKHHRLKLCQSLTCERGQGAWVGLQFYPLYAHWLIKCFCKQLRKKRLSSSAEFLLLH